MTKKWVQVTDPLNRDEPRTESCEQAPGILPTDTIVINGVVHAGTMATQTKDASSIPTGMGLLANPGGQFLDYLRRVPHFHAIPSCGTPCSTRRLTTGNGQSDAGTAGNGPSDGGTPAMDYTKGEKYFIGSTPTITWPPPAFSRARRNRWITGSLVHVPPATATTPAFSAPLNLPTGVGRGASRQDHRAVSHDARLYTVRLSNRAS